MIAIEAKWKCPADCYLLSIMLAKTHSFTLQMELKRSRFFRLDWLLGKTPYAIKRQSVIADRNYIGTLAKINRSGNHWHVLPQSQILFTTTTTMSIWFRRIRAFPICAVCIFIFSPPLTNSFDFLRTPFRLHRSYRTGGGFRFNLSQFNNATCVPIDILHCFAHFIESKWSMQRVFNHQLHYGFRCACSEST